MKTADIIQNQGEILEKMTDDRFLCDIDQRLIDNVQPYTKNQLSTEQLNFSRYISAILYRLINADDTLKEYDLVNKINVYISGFENACIITHIRKESDKPDYSLVFGPKLFSTICDLEKYKKTENQQLLIDLQNTDGFTEDDIAAVLAHELGHVFMQIKYSGIKHKLNESAADLFSVNLLKKAGYSPFALGSFFGRLALEKEYLENEKGRKNDRYVDAGRRASSIFTDAHATFENREIAVKALLLKQKMETGSNWHKIETVPILSGIDFFQIAKDFEYTEKVKEPELPKLPERPKEHEKDYRFSYDEVLERLQQDFSPENLNTLLDTDYSFTKKRGIPYEQKIKDILKKCPYQSIYEDDIPHPEVLKARIFIDIISKKDFQLKPLPEEDYYKEVFFPAYDIETGAPYKNKENENLYRKSINDYLYDEILKFYISHRSILLDEKSYRDFTLNDLINFKSQMKRRVPCVATFLDPLILKRILSKEDKEKKLSDLLLLLDSKTAINEYQTRQIYVEETAKLLAEKYGQDDGSDEYKKRIVNEVLNVFSKKGEETIQPYDARYSHVPTVLAKGILEKFSKQIVSKGPLSLEMETCIKKCTERELSSYDWNKQGATEAFLETVVNDTDAVDSLIDFLSHDYDESYVYDYLQDDILEKMDRSITEGSRAASDAKTTFNETADNFYQMHAMFWNSDIELRTAVISKMLFSKKQMHQELFAYSIEKIIPPKVKNRQFLVDIIGAFISTYESVEQPFLMAAMLSAQRKQNSSADFSVGEPLKEFLENIGPAGIKLGQALGSSPSVPEDIREVMQQMKHSSLQPSRWELYHLYEAAVPEDKRKELGKIIGSGSYFVAVESFNDGKSDETVYSLLRSYARERAESMFDQMQQMCDILDQKDDKKYKDFSKIFRGIIDKAASMSEIETDLNIGEIQDKMARQIYHNPEDGSGKILDLGNGKTATLHVAEWLSFGETYKETKKVHGEHFNDFEDEEFKKTFSKAYLQLELENLFAGNPFDHDRHGAQMKIQKIDDTHYNVGIFDNGAMSNFPPTKEECRQLGNVLNNILNNLPNPNNLLEVANYFLSKKRGFAHIFNDAVQQETKDGQSSDYLLAVQRGMLALNDYMRNLSDAEVLSVITSSINNVKKTTQTNVVDCITNENMTKLQNIVDYLVKQKNTLKSETEKKTQVKSEDSSSKLEKIIERIKNNSRISRVAFTVSRDVNWLGKKMGLSVVGRSRLAGRTNFFTDLRKECRSSLGFAVGTFGVLGIFGAAGVGIGSAILENAGLLTVSTSELGKALLVSMGANALFSSGIAFSDLPFIKRFRKKRSAFNLVDMAYHTRDRIRVWKAITSVQTMIEPTAVPIASQAYIMGEDKTSSGQETVMAMTEPVAPPPVVSMTEPVAPPPVVQEGDDRSQILIKNRISGR